MESLISTLQANGFQRSNLYMAWDFTVASEDSLTDRAHRDPRRRAAAHSGTPLPGDPIDGDEDGDDTPGDGVIDGAAPQFTVTGTSDPDGPGGNVLRQVDGELTERPLLPGQRDCPPVDVGLQPSAPGSDDPTLAPSSFATRPGAGRRAVPLHHPESVDDAGDRGGAGQARHLRPRPARRQYTQVNGQARLAQPAELGLVRDQLGRASPRTTSPAVSASLVDLSNFHQLVDRMQQGFVNFHYLGRALVQRRTASTTDAGVQGGCRRARDDPTTR